MQRRSFLASILAAATAPAFVRGGVLMPIKQPIWVPPNIFSRAMAGASIREQATKNLMNHLMETGRYHGVRIYTGERPANAGDANTGRLLLTLPINWRGV